jgi:chromosome partitioning protein
MKRLIFSSPKGGNGKSHLTRNLAIAASQDGFKIATADLDPQATLTIWSRRRPDPLKIPHYRVSWDDADALFEDSEFGNIDALLIDTPPSIEAQPIVFGKLLAAADLVIVPCRPTFDDAESVGPFLKHLRSEDMNAVAVLNCVKPRVNINAVKTYLIDAGELCPVEVADRTDYARAGAKGLGLLDIPNHPGVDEIRGVWRFMRGRVWSKTKVKARG